jgi:hypothetical protein
MRWTMARAFFGGVAALCVVVMWVLVRSITNTTTTERSNNAHGMSSDKRGVAWSTQRYCCAR